jgi:hypothetical protein
MLKQDARWYLHCCELRLPDLEFQTESSLVDEAERRRRRHRLEDLRASIKNIRLALTDD